MLATRRQQTIFEILKKDGSVRTAALAEHFKVSDQTIRRDFWKLEGRGLVTKGHGGAALTNYSAVPFRERTVLRRNDKLLIADVAQKLVQPGMTVALGPGTTTEALAHALNGIQLVIFTNSIAVARAITEPSTSVRLTGGDYRSGSELLVGDWAVSNLDDSFIDMSFIGVSGIDDPDGFTVTEADEARVLRQFIRIAKTAVVLSDASKLGRVAKATVAPLSAVHRLVTDQGAQQTAIKQLTQAGVEVTVAEPAAAEGGGFS